MECDPYTSVRVIGDNNGLPLVVAAIKTSAGKVKERGLDYYLEEYTKRKPDRARELLVEAVRKYPSVVEHWVFTVFIDGCSRACTHQLVRHRLASYTQESQRYSIAVAFRLIPEEVVEEERERVGDSGMLPYYALARWMAVLSQNLREAVALVEADDEVVDRLVEPLQRLAVFPPSLRGREKAWYAIGIAEAVKRYAELLIAGVPYEDARMVLPMAMRSRIMVTANLREWVHIIEVRTSPHAQWEIRCVAEAVRRELERVVPPEVFKK